MKNKKILTIIAIILFILGIILILIPLISKTRLEIKLSNLVTTDNSLTIDYTNISGKTLKNKKIVLFFENAKKKVIMTTIVEIDNLGVNETKTYEYNQDSNFKEIPKSYYYKDYNSNIKMVDNVNLDAKMTILLQESAKEVIEKNYILETFTDTTLTVNDIEKYLNKKLTIFHEKEYGCSLDESYVVVSKNYDTYNYVTYINCKIFSSDN